MLENRFLLNDSIPNSLTKGSEPHCNDHPNIKGSVSSPTSSKVGAKTSPSGSKPFWKITGLSKFSIAPIKFRIQKLEALGLDNSSKRSVQDSKSSLSSSEEPSSLDTSRHSTPKVNHQTPILVDSNESTKKFTAPKESDLREKPTENSFLEPLSESKQEPVTSSPKTLEKAEPEEKIKQKTSPDKNITSEILPDTSDTKAKASIQEVVSVPQALVTEKSPVGDSPEIPPLESNSKCNPKHKRNNSLSKLEGNKKTEEKRGTEKPPLGRRRCLDTAVGTSCPKKGAAGGSNSEGYFSSDQDEDSLRKKDSVLSSGLQGRHLYQTGTTPVKDATVKMRPPSPFSPASTYSEPLNETASILIEKMIAATPETKRKLISRPEQRNYCQERDTRKQSSESSKKGSKNEEFSINNSEEKISKKLSCSLQNSDFLNDQDDDISEAGTYTIDKDFSSLDETRARNRIDTTFGVSYRIDETASPEHVVDEYDWKPNSEVPPMSRSSPNWIHQWAAQVAEQTTPSLQPSRSFGLEEREDKSSLRRRLPSSPMLARSSSSSKVMIPSSKHQIRSLQAKSRREISFESQESGADAESDIDTSQSCPLTEEERFCSSLGESLRLNDARFISNHDGFFPTFDTAKRIQEGDMRHYDTKISGSRNGDIPVYGACQEDRDFHSDSSSEGLIEDRREMTASFSDNNPSLKFNRAFSLRRARLGLDDDSTTNATPLKKKINRPASAGSQGRERKVSSGSAMKSQRNSDSLNARKDKTGVKKQSHRPSSSVSTKEVDLQNWKRRKNYDPMKAAAEGKRKQVQKKLQESPHQQLHSPETPPGNSINRSASFHGTANRPNMSKWPLRSSGRSRYGRQEDDDDIGLYSMEEDVRHHPSPRRGGPLMRSPTSPNQTTPSSASRPPNLRNRRASFGRSDDSVSSFAARKTSIDDTGSEFERVSFREVRRLPSLPSTGASSVGPPAKSKPKMEALDNLVISTIHSLSVKVKASSESLLQKLKSQYNEEGDRAALLDEVLSHLSESDHSHTPGQTRSTSRELAGILRNLKNIEHAMEVIDRVIVLSDEDVVYCDENDTDYIPSDWLE